MYLIKKNNFLGGLIAGITGTLAVCCLAFVIYSATADSKLIEIGEVNTQTLSSATSGSLEDSDTETSSDTGSSIKDSQSTIMSKLDLLESIIDKYYLNDVDSDDLANGIYKGLLESLDDPYSCYYTADEYQALMESSSGVYCGIGASVSKNASTGVITIVKPFVDGPAYNAGLLPNDIIYKVDGEEVTGMDLSEVVSQMKGVEGTDVTITIIRDGEDDPLEFTITRKTIETPTITYEMVDEDNGIGYIIVSEFDEVTAEQYRSAITDLEKQGMKALIVDLRNNPGGRLDTVVDMLDRMLPEGLIVYQEDKYGNRDEEKSTSEEQFTQPLAVLINGNSASASEIFAGAIQDYGLGTLIGTTTFGKGIVQSIIPLNDGTAVKVTVSKYYTPSGRNIHGIGIDPDIEIDLTEELKNQITIDEEEDNQLQKAIDVLKEQLEELEQ